MLENGKIWDVLLAHKNTSLLGSFFFTAVMTCTEKNPAVEQRLLKVLKAEDALNLSFREVFDLLGGEAEWCRFSCFTLAPQGQNVEWCDLGIARPSHGAPAETSEVSLMKYGWSKMLLKTDCPASQTKKIGLIINCGEIRNVQENPRNSQLKPASVLSLSCVRWVSSPALAGCRGYPGGTNDKTGRVTADLTFLN